MKSLVDFILENSGETVKTAVGDFLLGMLV